VIHTNAIPAPSLKEQNTRASTQAHTHIVDPTLPLLLSRDARDGLRVPITEGRLRPANQLPQSLKDT
jgi:hypothetical protein